MIPLTKAERWEGKLGALVPDTYHIFIGAWATFIIVSN